MEEAVRKLDLDCVDPEHAAYILAIELFLAWPHRDQLHAMKKDGKKHYDIAKHFMVPEYVVDKYFSKSYCKKSDDISRLIEQLMDSIRKPNS